MKTVTLAILVVLFCCSSATAQEAPVIYKIKYDSLPGETAESIIVKTDKKELLKSYRFYGINTHVLTTETGDKSHFDNPTAEDIDTKREQYEKAF
tara:strand:+ start:873 stop:1157 length:285 start_codon:yes stop_codon:yes gene_type:complete